MMKKIFLEARYSKTVNLPASVIKKLPKKVALISSVQFSLQLPKIQKQMQQAGKKAIIGQGKQMHAGQVLGCDQRAAFEVYEKVDAFLYIGDGKFHPDGIALKSRKNVYCYDPLTNDLQIITDKDIDAFMKRKKGQLIKFLSATNVGVLISTKPGQNYLHAALRLRAQYPEKKFYYLVYETIDFASLENFPFIESLINAACPRIFDDLKCLNLFDLEEFKTLKTTSIVLEPKNKADVQKRVLSEDVMKVRPL